MRSFDCIGIWLPTLCLFVASGCATIISRSNYDIPVSCSSPGAVVDVYKDGDIVASSVTPTVLTLSSKGGYFIPATYRFKFRKDGFTCDEVGLDAGFDWWYLGNFILPYGILVALIVDPLTGAMWKFDDDISVYGNIRPLNERKVPVPVNLESKAMQDTAFQSKQRSVAPQVKPTPVNEIVPDRPVSTPVRPNSCLQFEVENISL